MSVRSAQSVTVLFTTRRFDTGAATNADSTPTGTLYVNGTSNAASVTVTNITTGVYKAAVTLPTLAVNDVVDLRIAATVNSVSDNAVVWRDTKDVFAGAIPDAAAGAANGLGIIGDNTGTVSFSGAVTYLNGVTIANGGFSASNSGGPGMYLSGTTYDIVLDGTGTMNGTIATVTNLTNAPTNGDLTATMKASVTTAATAATPTISLGANAPAGWLNAAAFATGSLNGKGDWLLASSYAAPDNAGISEIKTTTDLLATGWTVVGGAIVFTSAAMVNAPGGTGGAGTVLVNQDTGGTNNLQVLDSNLNPIQGATLRAYLTSDYTAGTFTSRGESTTDAFGNWATPMYLLPEDYTLTVAYPGDVTGVVTFTVS